MWKKSGFPPLFFPLFTNSVDILFWGWLSIIPNDARESHNRINWIRAISGRVEILLVRSMNGDNKAPIRDVGDGWAGWGMAHQDFGRSVNPISTRGPRYAHHVTTCPPGFSDLATALISSGTVFAIISNLFKKLPTSTLESGINIAVRLLIFWLFSSGYGLIPDFIL